MDRSKWIHELLTQYETRLIRYTNRWVRQESALDIVQEAFLRLCKEKQSELSGFELQWLYRVCRNLAIDHQRREKTMKRDSAASEKIDQVVDHSPTPDQGIEQRQAKTEMQKAISQLPENQREVLQLKFDEGLSYKDISVITGHSESYVGVLIHEAIKSLRTELAPGKGGRL